METKIPAMTARQRFRLALDGAVPDRLPVTTHHVMDFFLRKYMDGISTQEFFDHFGLDPILWLGSQHTADASKDQWMGPDGFVFSDQWRIEHQDSVKNGKEVRRYQFVTPRKTLTMTLQCDEYTGWVLERVIKDKSDIDVLGEFMTEPVCDIESVNRQSAEFGERGLVRGHVLASDVWGQPGVWQDAATLFGIEELIMATCQDPDWVHEFLAILQRRKLNYVRSLSGAQYDILELGGGDASSTVISPRIFDEFVAPYDAPLIQAAHEAGQRIAYHTCGGMMPFLERIADMGPDAMETFTPRGMGGDTDLAEAKRRIGQRVCMIGGYDQFHFFNACSPEETRREVRRCFEAAGAGGGYILSPSDHFFDADPQLVRAFADEGRKCIYEPWMMDSNNHLPGDKL